MRQRMYGDSPTSPCRSAVDSQSESGTPPPPPVRGSASMFARYVEKHKQSRSGSSPLPGRALEASASQPCYSSHGNPILDHSNTTTTTNDAVSNTKRQSASCSSLSSSSSNGNIAQNNSCSCHCINVDVLEPSIAQRSDNVCFRLTNVGMCGAASQSSYNHSLSLSPAEKGKPGGGRGGVPAQTPSRGRYASIPSPARKAATDTDTARGADRTLDAASRVHVKLCMSPSPARCLPQHPSSENAARPPQNRLRSVTDMEKDSPQSPVPL
ncbi:hypothetical protein STCU_10508 [Strigomonas culicis]|uniref:Uncharacterized protein n=1 Tax=Strigomonas culicis TaxID=28005 RepID=S9USW6_9TRYP|nr:hypothetical protein STCU_10508 [Strigomonas culicis]|eukprot:EPY17621.1 hypothetical protein STCU_10508 [Strigomonas culicis]